MTVTRRIIPVLVLLTAANAAVSQSRANPEPHPVTSLSVADHIAGLPSTSCTVYVGFRSDCPFCGRAADTEALGGGSPMIHWVGTEADPGAAAYPDLVGEQSRVIISDALYWRLRVEAVPAAILVDGEGHVRSTWTYRGDEDMDALRARCEQPLTMD